MNILVVYDSLYGNTKKVAEAMAEKLGCQAVSIKNTDPTEFKGIDFLIMGSPTHGGRPSEDMHAFLDQIPKGSLNGLAVATFDTRFAQKEHGKGMELLMRMIGFAAPRLARNLRSKGAKVVDEPAGFIVMDKEGPLKEGELDRAKNWAATVAVSAG